MKGHADISGFAASHLRFAAACGHRQEQRVEEADPALLKRSIKDRRLPGNV